MTKVAQYICYLSAGITLVIGGALVLFIVLRGPPPNMELAVVSLAVQIVLPAVVILCAIYVRRSPRLFAAIVLLCGIGTGAYALLTAREINFVMATVGVLWVVSAVMFLGGTRQATT